MATTVFTGWRTVTPGKCDVCGYDSDWECDGRGTVFCSCQRCPECHTFDGHAPCCSALEYEGPTSQPEDPDPRYDDEGGF